MGAAVGGGVGGSGDTVVAPDDAAALAAEAALYTDASGVAADAADADCSGCELGGLDGDEAAAAAALRRICDLVRAPLAGAAAPPAFTA